MDEESNISITRKGNKFIVIVDGKKSIYKSVDDMPPDVRKKHEEFQALFKESFSDKTRYMQKEGRELTFYINGKKYHSIDEIPEGPDRDYFLKKQQEEAPEFMVLPADKKKAAEKEKMGKLYDCPKCNKKVKAKKGFFGGLKCIDCGTKLKE
jgi:hypothetical protein